MKARTRGLSIQVLLQGAAWAATLAIPCAALAQDGAAAQQQRLSTPRNTASQRYEINQTFGGQAYYKDNSVWVYDKDFAELFGLTAKHIEAIEGATAAAFRIEEAPFQECGFGGRDETCSKVSYCYLDLYFDENKTPLPWATESKQQWIPMYHSMRWLRPLSEMEKPYGMTAPDTPAGIVRNEATVGPLVALADPVSKRQVIATTNQNNDRVDAEGVSGSMGILGYSRGFYQSLSVLTLQTRCSQFGRRTVNIRLDAKRFVYDPPIASFNRVTLPQGFVQRMKDAIATYDKRQAEFYRSLFPALKDGQPASGTK